MIFVTEGRGLISYGNGCKLMILTKWLCKWSDQSERWKMRFTLTCNHDTRTNKPLFLLFMLRMDLLDLHGRIYVGNESKVENVGCGKTCSYKYIVDGTLSTINMQEQVLKYPTFSSSVQVISLKNHSSGIMPKINNASASTVLILISIISSASCNSDKKKLIF